MNQSPPFQPGLAEDSHYPPGVRILLYLSDTLLRAIHHLAATPNQPRATWLQLWALNETTFQFVRQLSYHLFRLGFRLPHIDSPWFDIVTRSGPHFRSLPLSQASLLLPTPFNPLQPLRSLPLFPPSDPSPFDPVFPPGLPFDPRYDLYDRFDPRYFPQ